VVVAGIAGSFAAFFLGLDQSASNAPHEPAAGHRQRRPS
jgi:hypothetical protein